MFTLTFNGKPFDPDDFHDALMEAALDKVKEHLHEEISSIRGPVTGEFPVVSVTGNTRENICARVEASPELLALVRQRLSPDDLQRTTFVEQRQPAGHKAFLSYGWEDRDLFRELRAGSLL